MGEWGQVYLNLEGKGKPSTPFISLMPEELTWYPQREEREANYMMQFNKYPQSIFCAGQRGYINTRPFVVQWRKLGKPRRQSEEASWRGWLPGYALNELLLAQWRGIPVGWQINICVWGQQKPPNSSSDKQSTQALKSGSLGLNLHYTTD